MLKIGTKLGIAIGVFVALSIIIGLVAFTMTQLVQKKVEEITEVKEPINSAVYALENNLLETAFATLGYLSTGDSLLLAAVARNTGQYPHIQKRYTDAAANRSSPEQTADFQAAFARIHELAGEQISLRNQQTRTMQTLLQNVDAIDRLLSERIQTSVSVNDPVAFRRLQSVLEMKANVNAISKALGTFLATGESQFERRFQRAQQDFKQYLGVYQYVVLSDEEEQWSWELRRLSDESLKLANTVIALDKQRRESLGKFLAADLAMATMLNDRIQQTTEPGLTEAKADVFRAGQRANASILIVLVFSVIFGVGAGYVITTSITGPLHKLASAMHAISHGDLAQRVDLASSDELRVLGEAFNQMTGQLVHANEELRVSEERFRIIFENAPVGIALADAEGRMLQTNPALHDMLGTSSTELQGKVLWDPLTPALHQSLFSPKPEADGGRYQGEISLPRKDGGVTWVSVNVSRVLARTDRLSYSIMMMEDITHRRATEQQMRMMVHTLTSMNESVVITDAHNMILSVNPAFCTTYGYPEDESIGKSADALRLPVTPASHADLARDGLGGGGWTGEGTGFRHNGDEFPVLLSTSVVRDDTGSAIANVSISRDITEQKRLQHKLEEAERKRLSGLRRFALSVQRAQEEERARISRELHDDLCQRLTGMKYRVEVLEDQIRPVDKKPIRRLHDLAQELDKTIVDVRRISSDLRPSVLDDFGLVTAIRMLCKEFEKLHSIRTEFQQNASIPPAVNPALDTALYRIAQEALSNVAKHAGATKAKLHLLYDESSMRLIVEDNGKGFHAEQTARAKESGHGFGLMNMRERTELFGGVFQIDSATGRGTTISSTLPLGEHEKDTYSDRG